MGDTAAETPGGGGRSGGGGETRADGGDESGGREKRGLYTQLWFWVIIAIILGILVGLIAPDLGEKARWLADAFIQLITTITGPVIFVTVVVGIASLGDLARAGGLAIKALTYFFSATVVALALGLIVGNLVQPGGGFDGQPTEEGRADAKESIGEAGSESGLVSFITDSLLPESIVGPFVENEILRVLVIAILTASAITALNTETRERVVGVFQVLAQIIFGIIRIIMWAAPLGAFGGMAYTVAQFGSGALADLALLAVTFWATCAIFVFGVLGLVARFLGGFNIFRFIRLLRDELLINVGTSSSETVLPRLLAKLEAAGASRQVVGVVIPTG